MAVDEIVFCSAVSPLDICVDRFLVNQGGLKVLDIEFELPVF